MNFCHPYFPARKAENILMTVFLISFLCPVLLSFDIFFIIWLHIISLAFIFHLFFFHWIFLPAFSCALYFAGYGNWNARPILYTRTLGISYSVGSKTRQNLFVPALWPERSKDFRDIMGFIYMDSSCKTSNKSPIKVELIMFSPF